MGDQTTSTTHDTSSSSASPACRPSLLAPFSFALFLGTSWTWCIGMFLPVILVRDYGMGGFIVFAIPNVIGAAAMGWVLKSSTDSLSLAWRHGRMAVWFSLWTIAFHLFFLTWIVRPWAGPAAYTVAPAWVAMILFLGSLNPAGDRISGLLIYLVSLGAAAVCVLGGGAPPGAWGDGAHVLPQLAMIAPVCVFGFLLCPYLDLTFHRARQSTSVSGAKLAFGMGFGGFFFSMILFTLFYAAALGGWLGGTLRENPTPAFVAAVAVHLAGQLSLTVALHAREVFKRSSAIAPLEWPAIGLLLIAAPWIGTTDFAHHFIDARVGGEFVYLIFLSAYGLAFPAYVWLCMIPNWKTGKTTRRQWLVWAAAVLLACPMFAAGFLLNRHAWLLPGVAVVLLARLFCSNSDRR